MNDIDILKTACKVFGLYFLIQTVISIREVVLYSTVYGIGDTDDAFAYVGGSIYQGVFNMVIGFVLIFKSDFVTQKLNPAKTGELKLNFEKTDWIELSLIIVSALTLLDSLSEIMYRVVSYLYYNDYETNLNKKVDVFYTIFKVGLALILLLNARNLAIRLKKVGDKDDKFLEKKD